MKSPSRPRTKADLPQSITRQLNMYALAASAAGVGMLAFSPTAQAKIVYTHTDLKFGPRGTIDIDLNHDGINDFQLVASESASGGTYGFARLSVRPSANNKVWYHVIGNTSWAAALYDRVPIGPKGHFLKSGGRLWMAFVQNGGGTYKQFFGPWVGRPGYRSVKDRYLGLKFFIKGKVHFGWARLKVTSAGFPTGIVATLTGYAYETIPGKGITAGKTKGPHVVAVDPVSLGHLAAGASAIPAWRVQQTVATTH